MTRESVVVAGDRGSFVSLTPEERLFAEFEDLLDDHDDDDDDDDDVTNNNPPKNDHRERSSSPRSENGGGGSPRSSSVVSSSSDDDDSDDDAVVHKLDASALTLNDLLAEMERRGLRPRGFFEDDARALQEEFDREHGDYVASKRRERREARESEARRAARQRRRARRETALAEERAAAARNRPLAEELEAVRRGVGPTSSSSFRPEVDDVTARTLAKAAWSAPPTGSLVALDVSGMGLSDVSGAHVCRALRRNRSIRRLELGGNRCGRKTCAALGDSLTTNDVVEFVCLESSPLLVPPRAADADDDDRRLRGVRALADMLRVNRGLRHLSLWRCGIGPEGCRVLVGALFDDHQQGTKGNGSLTCLDLGYNGWEDHDRAREVRARLEANRAAHRERQEAERARSAEQREEEARGKAAAEAAHQRAEVERWIEDEKTKRAEARRTEMNRVLRERAEERRRLEEEEARAQAARAATESKKKKKKKKKGKKKK